GAGPHRDGQVQVFHDFLGLSPNFVPKHAKLYAELGRQIVEATQRYIAEVREGAFPTDRESFAMDEAALAELLMHGHRSAQIVTE
ncbi:MAG: 3-methyl-2-oxobutanoate hydroxymethyltransferase, partial [Dehalococcoidia bacterium]